MNLGSFGRLMTISIDDPIEYNIPGFIRWIGDTVEVEID